MQIPCGVHSQVPEKNVIRSDSAGAWRDLPGTVSAEGMRDHGRASDARSCAHAHLCAAEVCGGAGDGFIKGKSAIHIARVYAGRRRNFVGQHFWARGYWVSTVGKNEAAVRRYIQEQEKEDKRLEQMELTAL